MSIRLPRVFGVRFLSLVSIPCWLACAALAVVQVRAIAAQEPATPQFRNVTADVGLELANAQSCWVDLDNDGFAELCSGGIAWHNEGARHFTKLAEGLGDVVAADFDNDGFTDLFSWTALKAFRNLSGKSFEPLPMCELPKCVSRAACCADFNGDGFVDVYVGGYEDWDAGITYPDLFLVNDQGKTFQLARTDERYRARGVSACDFDEDGDLDIYVSNYRLQPNLLWRNDGQGNFTDAAADLNALATSPGFEGGHSIGAAWGDFDNDGRIDLFAGNFAHVDGRGDQPKSRFLRNPGATAGFVFEDRGPCGVHYQESYASPSAADYDNDGDLDLFFTTVYGIASFGVKNQPTLFRNDGDFAFSDDTASAGLADLEPTYQAAWADFDNDGDLDLVTAGKLFENQCRDAHFLRIHLDAQGSRCNRLAVGAQVRVSIGELVMTRQVEAGTGEGNQNETRLHFGLGPRGEPVHVRVTWPDGTIQEIENLPVDRTHDVTHPQES